MDDSFSRSHLRCTRVRGNGDILTIPGKSTIYTGPRQLAYTTLRFFSCSLTRRASRTRRGYRWPTSEPISYSSKRHSQSTSLGRHEHHYHHPPLPPPTATIQQYKNNTDTTNNHQHNLHSTVHSIVCKRFILFAFRSLSLHSRPKKKNSSWKRSLRNILNVAAILNPKLD